MRGETHWMQIWTRLKREDPVLTSARQTVEIDMDFGGRLAGMELWALWELGYSGAPPPRELLRETTVLANPNRERAWIRTAAGDPGPPGPRWGTWHWCVVWDREAPGAEHALRVCERLLARRKMRCRELVRAAVWGLAWHPAAGDPRQATLDVALLRSRRRGLLVNPHVQAMQLFEGGVPFPWWIGRLEMP